MGQNGKGMNPEVERFLGWITMNCSPKVVDITFLGTSLTKPGVMVHNVDAKILLKNSRRLFRYSI